ncbi:MAG: hypothetical protein QNI89_16205 [Desulfobacterales bacterium]|nr:hypothetical protein [Desulfobacterales bacterium]
MKKSIPLINAKLRGIMIICVVAAMVSACTNKRYFQPSCTLPSGVNLEEALDHSRADLGRLECEQMFDGYYDRLLDVAKRDPDIENRRRFSEFLVWANDQGIIDKIQARNYYNRYFNTTFMSLPDDYNVCSSCPDGPRRDLELELQKELGQKEEGLLRACQDKQAYYAAADQYNSILLLLDATCTACRNK